MARLRAERKVASRIGNAVLLSGAHLAFGLSANAQPAPAPAVQEQAGTGLFTDLFAPSRSNLLGDPGGMRSSLADDGLSFGLQETSEELGNVTGGVQQGANYDGATEISLGIDTKKAFGWNGGTFNVSALQIHGSDLSANNLYTLQTASGIEANASTRLWELWYQQAFLDGKADVKIGQQSIDQEFMLSQYASIFVNSAMSSPVLPSEDLYAGGPMYPLSSLGVRLRVQPTGATTVLAGVFDDNPPGGPFNNDSQVLGPERWGTKFNLNTGALFIAEAQYTWQPVGLPGTYKLGFWYDTGWFPDQQFDTNGLSLADPNSTGVARMHHGNYSLYGLVDQMIWRPDPKGARSLGLFLSLTGAPADRNLVSFSADGGVVLKAPFSGRDNDTVGAGFGVAKVSGAASALDQDIAAFAGAAYPVRGTETFIEVTYQYQAAGWWVLQPDFQYVFNPGGGIPNPLAPPQRIGNEAVLGLRTVITF